jgi:hypothetical protein
MTAVFKDKKAHAVAVMLGKMMNLEMGPNIKVHDMIAISEPLTQLLGYKKSWHISDNGAIVVEGVEVVPKISRIHIDTEGEEGEEKHMEPISWGVCPWIYITMRGGEEVAALLDTGAECNCISQSLASKLEYRVRPSVAGIKVAVGFDGKKVENGFVSEIRELKVKVLDGRGNVANI